MESVESGLAFGGVEPVASEPRLGLPTRCTTCVLLPCKHPHFLDGMWLHKRLADIPGGKYIRVDTFSQCSELSASVPEWNGTAVICTAGAFRHREPVALYPNAALSQSRLLHRAERLP